MRNFLFKIGVSIGLIAPLTALFYLARSVADVPFPAFDVMDWLIRILPGDVITFGIDQMIDFILAVNPEADLDSTAKASERAMAVLLFVGLGTLLGLVYILLAESLHRRQQFFATEFATGLAFGTFIGIGLAYISATYNVSAAAAPAMSGLWIISATVLWGLAHNALQRYLLPPMSEPEATAETRVIDRRQFLVQFGGITATITVIGAGLGEWLRPKDAVIVGGDVPLANAGEGLMPAKGTRPEYTPLANHYRIDINSGDPPNVDPEGYRLKIFGLVEQDLEVSLNDIRSYDPLVQFITLSCISNRIAGSLISTTRWTGVPMKTLLADWKPTPEATHIKIKSLDGFDEIVDIATIMSDERVMLAYEWDGVPLLPKHGFPLRIYIPDHFGMKQPKWIESMEFTSAWEEGYWVRRGWSKDAFVRTTAVIDTVAVDDAFELDGKTYIPIGGIAYSGARGISKVEVRIDEEGDWLEAQLRTPLSETTWVIWRLDWELQPGRHTFTVRTYEADGTPQLAERHSNRPDGATGYHSKENVRVSA